MSDAGHGAVKGAISLPRGVFGMPLKEPAARSMAEFPILWVEIWDVGHPPE